MIARTALAVVLFAAPAFAQDDAASRVMNAVRSAMAPGLAFPATDASGAVPVNNNTEALWMVRWPEAGEQVIEVMANPLNEVNQLRATRAMAQIQVNIEAAQRRAALQYDRAVAEAKRTGRSQDVDGVTLSDEGTAGAKIDAESHLLIEVSFNQPSYKFSMSSSVQPQARPTPAIPGLAIAIPANTYRDDRGERFAEAETLIYFGSVAPPVIGSSGDNTYELTAAAKPSSTPVHSLVVRLREMNS